MPQNPEHRTRVRRPAVVGSIGLLIVLACVVAAPHFWQIGRTIGPACAIGVNGTAASVTVQGWTAPFACRTITQQLAGATHGLSAAVLVPQPVHLIAGPAVCQGIVAHDHIIIHDDEPLKLVGNLLCVAVSRGRQP